MYSVKTAPIGELGLRADYTGPGMPRYANTVCVSRECDAEALARLLAHAYEAGRRAKAEEVRVALGLYGK